jgi:hypothetical protein
MAIMILFYKAKARIAATKRSSKCVKYAFEPDYVVDNVGEDEEMPARKGNRGVN